MSNRFSVKLAAVAAAAACLTAGAARAGSSLPVIVVHAPSADVRLEVAVTPEQQERGLMYRTSLAPHTGMLFVFGSDGPVAFWMKNTLVPLDMVFVSADGHVRTVFRNVPPAPPSMADDAIPKENGAAKYVIELPAGEASRDGIAPGTMLAIPKT